MAAGAGKVLVASTTTAFSGACPSGVNLIDLVGYGSTANCSETGPAPAPSTTTADLRAGDGCVDTNNNSTDFTAGAPNPRNTLSPTNLCVVPIVPNCPGSLSTVTGNAASTNVSASDADGTVTSAVITSPAVSGITLDGFTPASGVGGTATATLNVANTTATGTYNVVIQYSNNDSPTPQTASCTVVVNVYPQPSPFTSAIKISQIYGGGGNSGSTYRNDFIELYNTSLAPVDISGWSVQYTGATTAFAAQTTGTSPTPLVTIIPGGSIIQPGHHFLIQESLGAGGTTTNPTPDLTGGIFVGSTAGKIALVASSVVLNGGTAGNCPTDPLIVDFIGYGISPTTATCSETAPTVTMTNTTAPIRKNNGCLDTNNNSNDFLIDGPIPRNSAFPAHGCGGDPTQISANGLATPDYLLPSSNTLLTVNVTAATAPSSTGITVNANLTSIGGTASQQFYDDATHGDQVAGDNKFSYLQTIGPFIITGAKTVTATITDAQARSVTEGIAITVQSPTCGVERWSVKTGTDPDVAQVDLNPVPTTIDALRALTPPTTPPDNTRFGVGERTVYVVEATMTLYKLEDDVDYHMVLQDANGHTIVTEIPCPCCVGVSSPFAAGVANARAKFDARFTATTFFQAVTVPVRVTGVGFFDFIHGQTGVAPNGIELHPILDINFLDQTTTSLVSSANPSQYGQSVQITATVASVGPNTPTGTVTFKDGVTVVSGSALNGSGQASFTTSSLSVGSHSITASYPGDTNSLPSTSTVLTQVVNKADQFINFGALAGKTYGDAPFNVSATASSGLPVSFQILSGPATIAGNTVTITGAGSVTVRASQAGDGNYNAAPDVDQSFAVAQATATVNVSGFSGPYDGNAHGASGSATGVNSEDLSSLLNLGASFTNVPGGTAHWTFTGNTNYAPSSGDVLISINKASSITTVTCPASETYTGSAIEPCTASYSGVNGLSGSLTPTYANNTDVGTATASATYGGDANHDGSTGNANFEITKASSTTTVTCTGSPIYTGAPITPCSVTVTGANLNLTPAADYTNNVNAGTNTATASYTFAGDANHTGSSDSKNFSIGTATATINVAGYTGAYDGNSHGASGTATGVNGEDLSALLNIGASFTNVPGGTAHWTFAGNGNYEVASGDVNITITKATPTITWNNPADIVYGTALSSTQLNATANVAGNFNYTPASGTVLSAGSGQSLLASFTPTDTTNYNATSKTVVINVLKATPSFSNLSSPTIAYGTATTNLSGKLTFGSLIPTTNVAMTLNTVTQNAAIQAGGNFSSSFATGSLTPGSYSIAYNYAGDSNFNSASGSGTLQVGYGIVTLYDQTKVHQSGSTIPIKLKITDANGNNLSSAGTVVTAMGISLVSTSVYGPVEDAGNANPDNNFRFTSDSYTYNLKTTGLATGTYNLYFTVGTDPTLHTVQFQIK